MLVILRRMLGQGLLVAQFFQALFGTETIVCGFLIHQFPGIFLIDIQTFGLQVRPEFPFFLDTIVPIQPFIRMQLKVSKSFHNVFQGAGHKPGLVSVLNAHDELAVVLARQ